MLLSPGPRRLRQADLIRSLERNIRELKATEGQMMCEKQRAEKSEYAKHQFLANMSHEMRTPLNATLGFARHLEKSRSDADQINSVKMIIESGDHLLITLNDILDFIKIEIDEIRFISKPLSISNSIKSTIQLVKQEEDLKKIDLNFSVMRLSQN